MASKNTLFELTAKINQSARGKNRLSHNVIKSIEAVKEGAEPGIMTYISDVG